MFRIQQSNAQVPPSFQDYATEKRVAAFLGGDIDFNTLLANSGWEPATWVKQYCAFAKINPELAASIEHAVSFSKVPAFSDACGLAKGIILAVDAVKRMEQQLPLLTTPQAFQQTLQATLPGFLENTYARAEELTTTLNTPEPTNTLEKIDIYAQIANHAMTAAGAVGIDAPFSDYVIDACKYLIKKKARELHGEARNTAAVTLPNLWLNAVEDTLISTLSNQLAIQNLFILNNITATPFPRTLDFSLSILQGNTEPDVSGGGPG